MVARTQTQAPAKHYPDQTLPALLVERAAQQPRRTAIRAKEFGIWHPMSWQAYAERVSQFALGLLEIGFARGDRLAMIGDNRPELLVADLAVQALGGAGVTLFPESLPPEVAFIVDHSEATIVVAEDQEQVDKLLDAGDGIPKVRKIVCWDRRGLLGYDDPRLLSFEEVERLGAERAAREPDLYRQHVEQGDLDDVAVILYTSGTTGEPKGAMLSHRTILAATASFFAAEPVSASYERLVFLPLAWAGERYFATAGHLLSGYVLNFPEEPDTLRQDIREIGPHHLLGAPRMWEDYLSTVELRMHEASWLKRRLYRWALPVGYRRADLLYSGKRRGPFLWLALLAADALVFRPLRDQLGLLRAERIYSGGAALGSEIFRYYHALGIPLKQVYGQTECGIVTVHWDKIKTETMGRPAPGLEMTTSDEGEILCRGDNVFVGYYKNPEATAAAFIDGWLRTGDEGYFDEDGQLVVVDRIRTVAELESGERFSPTLLENKLKFSPYVKEAVCIGHGRSQVVALVNIDGETVGKWAEDRRIPYTTYADLTQREQVIELVRTEVERVNLDLPESLRIVRFCVLHKELDADDEEITRTRKVRRGLVEQRYGFIIEALYGGERALDVESEVVYRDGRRARMATRLILSDATEPERLAEVVA
jgi:long-chain acyl-CoA synthetase